MLLAKPHLDIGLFTNDIKSHREFWGNIVGLNLNHELELGSGWTQHRYDAHGSVIKVNHLVAPLQPKPSSGYVGLSIANAGCSASFSEGRHPDGDFVRLVQSGTDGIVGIGITVRTPDPERMMDFYIKAMEFKRVGAFIASCGDSLLFVEEGAGGSDFDDLAGPAFRYLTVQIFDADDACASISSRGGRVIKAPVNFGTVARYGFVADPDGNWIEISARTSLTGIPPPVGKDSTEDVHSLPTVSRLKAKG